MPYKLIASAALVMLAGCTTTYIPPAAPLQPMDNANVPDMNAIAAPAAEDGLVSATFEQAWTNIQQYASERYKTVSQNKARGEMTLFVDAFEPSTLISCGMTENQGDGILKIGSFDTYTEFLSTISQQTPVNLDVTVRIKLTAKDAKQTLVKVHTEYDLTIGYQTNPSTGALIGGNNYRFDSNGSAAVAVPNANFVGQCRPTGAVEQSIVNAAAGNG
jgi:hypothetical protein